ncbi:MAG: hypothetical protein AVDCRST_MAG59-5291 [uncultured Thermomicrobiales bacterium]|uniref:Uncharacterized protein n=1 Tax=uncultured Thermomicrobiales bacterium TaxID=1645740 RepID=A0A6J4VTI2_9BACT|nr:MAG: hypothetical protein AVDCRST_MAG59-5291 [uncultured Thermomicrobiales bacterium]
MVLTDEELVQIEKQVLSELEKEPTPYAPRELITRLRDRHSEHLIRAAIWYLIDRNEVELTRDRLLKLAGTESGIPMGTAAPQR